jgi:hypothetical protein
MNTDEKIVGKIVEHVFYALQSLGFFKEEPRIKGFELIRDPLQGIDQGFRAAASVLNGTPIMILGKDLDVKEDHIAIVHEAIHIAQIVKGDLSFEGGCEEVTWKGRRYKTLPVHDKNYFINQPWEKEADELLLSVLEKIATWQVS